MNFYFLNYNLNSMKKLLLVIVALLVLAASAHEHQKYQGAGGQTGIIMPKQKGTIPPNIRKCLNVECQAGFFCFYGRCKRQDTACFTVKCSDGFRCLNGQCVKQKHKPKKMVCTPMGFKLKKQKCDKSSKKLLSSSVTKQTVCGFNKKTGNLYEFVSPSQACSDNTCDIDFYYTVPCKSAPRICNQKEECMNGVCSNIFDNPVFRNNQACNSNAECKASHFCAGHKCIKMADMYNYLSSKSEVQGIPVNM